MGDKKTLLTLRLAAWASLLLVLVNHLLQPKAFAATQVLFDYHDGLARRGLVGAVLNVLTLPEVSASQVTLALVVITLAGTIALFSFLLVALGGSRGGLLLVVVVLNSFAMASFVGNVGYLDGLLVALTVLAIASDPAGAVGMGLRLGAVVLGVLIHENMLAYFTVLMAFDLYMARRRVAAFAPVVVGLIVLGVLVWGAGRSPDEALAYGAYLQSKAGFVVDPQATIVAARGIGANLSLMQGMWGTTQMWAWLVLDGLPLLGLSAWLIWLNLRLLGDRAGRVERYLLILAVLAPLSLNAVAFDVVRFGVASVIAGAFAACVVVMRCDGARARLEGALTWPHAVLVLVLVSNMFTTQVNEAAGHMGQFPWVLLNHLNWHG